MDSILQHWKKSKMEPKIRRDRPAKICFAPMQTVGLEMVQDTFLVPLLDRKVRQNKILGKEFKGSHYQGRPIPNHEGRPAHHYMWRHSHHERRPQECNIS